MVLFYHSFIVSIKRGIGHVPSGGQYGCAHAQSAASLTELSSGAGTAIVRDLERRGTPRGNYKISEADDDVVIDAEAYTEGPST